MNNKGISLIELVIAVALLAFVSLGVVGLMSVGGRLFASSNRELSLQNDAQTALNQLNSFIIGAQRGITYGSVSGENKLVIYNNDVAYNIVWNSTDKKLYFSEQAISGGALQPASDKEVLAEHVESFSVDTTKVETDEHNVIIYMQLKDGDKSFHTQQTYSLRNDIGNVANLAEAFAGTPLDMSNSISDIEISATRVYCARGQNYAFSALVKGAGFPSQSVTWSLTGNADSTTTINELGILTVGAGETSNKLTVQATSVVDPTKHSEEATVYVVLANNIEVTYNADSAIVGHSFYLNAKVLCTTPPDGSYSLPDAVIYGVTWSLPDDAPKGVTILPSTAGNCFISIGGEIEEDAGVMQQFQANNQAIIYVKVKSQYDPNLVVSAPIVIKPSNLNGIDVMGNLTANRNSITELSAKLEAQGLTSSEIRTTWAITKDAGLGDKVSINEKTGVLTVAKNIAYDREFTIEVTATAAINQVDVNKSIKTTVSVVIPKVTISLPLESISVEKGSSDRIAFIVHGLKVEKGDVVCTTAPSMKNTSLYCTENQCIISVGEKESRELSAVRIMLKENTAVNSSITLYVLNNSDMYNVEGRQNIYAKYVNEEKNVTTKNGTVLKYFWKDGVIKLRINDTQYNYQKDYVKNGVTGWWMAEPNGDKGSGLTIFIPVPGLAAELPSSITSTYKLNYNGNLLTYSYKDGKTYVAVDGYDKLYELNGELWKKVQ